MSGCWPNTKPYPLLKGIATCKEIAPEPGETRGLKDLEPLEGLDFTVSWVTGTHTRTAGPSYYSSSPNVPGGSGLWGFRALGYTAL